MCGVGWAATVPAPQRSCKHDRRGVGGGAEGARGELTYIGGAGGSRFCLFLMTVFVADASRRAAGVSGGHRRRR
jgi:hypothetical protein